MVDLRELCDVADALDEKAGLDLYRPSKKTRPKQVFNRRMDDLEESLLVAVCEINQIAKERYLDETGKVRPADQLNFNALSKLQWGSADKFATNSKLFRHRFLSLLLSSINDNLDDIVAAMVAAKSTNKSLKHEEGCILLDELIGSITLTAESLGHRDGAMEPLIDLSAALNLIVTKKSDKFQVLVPQFIEVVNEDNGMPKSIVAQQMIALGYMLATGKTKSSILLPYQSYEGRTSFKDHLMKLGEAIADRGSDRLTIGYQAFIQASPMIVTNHTDAVANKKLRLGIYAVAYAAFIANTKTAQRRLRAII